MSVLSAWHQYAFVIRQLTARELKRKYARSSLGILWSILNPLLSMAVLSLIFLNMFRRSIENYPIYYLTGYLVWQTFTLATTSAMTALPDNKPLLLKVRFPMDIFLLARVYTAGVNLVYSLIAYAVMLIVFGISFKWTMLLAPVYLFLLFCFSLGMSYLLAVACVFFGDVRHLYTVVLTLWMYCSALFYPVSQLSEFMQTVVLMNPIYAYISSLRGAVLDDTLPSGLVWLQMLFFGLFTLLIGRMVFKFYRKKIVEFL